MFNDEIIEDPTLVKIKDRLTLFALLEEKYFKKFYKYCDLNFPELHSELRDSRPSFEGWTLLHHAAHGGDVQACAYLIDRGHPIDLVDSAASLVTPLMLAISHNNVEAASKLVQFGALLQKADIKGENALHYAARDTGIMVKRLIEAAGCTREEISRLTTATNVKRKFPEDLAVSDVVKDTLLQFRTLGYIPTKVRNLPIKAKRLIAAK